MLCSEIYHQRNDWNQLVAFIKSREIFSRCRFVFSLCFFMCLRRCIHLRRILQRIIQHIPHRHGVMNIGLILYAKQQIGSLIVPLDDPLLQNVSDLLHRRLRSIQSERQRNGRCVHITQLFGLDDLSAIINEEVEYVRKHIGTRHVRLCQCVFILCHWHHHLLHYYCINFI